MKVIDVGKVRTVQLDTPPANAIDWTALRELEGLIDGLTDPQAAIRTLVFQGSGRFFCAGVDIAMIAESTTGEDGLDRIAEFGSRLQAVVTRIEELRIPTIAAMRGPATGGGLELALACDLRVAAEDSRYGLPEIKLGLLPGAGGTQRLTALAGRATSLRLILRGELVSGTLACSLGIVHWALPPDEVEPFAAELATELACYPTDSINAAKRCITAPDRLEGFARELEFTGHLMRHPESRRLLRDFIEKKATR